MKMINFNKEKLKQLKACYDKAVKDKKESFTLNGDEYLTSYAKYLIEYLKSKLT